MVQKYKFANEGRSNSKKLALLFAIIHVVIIASSNFLVQIPVKVLGYNATWGAFTFPFIFLATDLTVRIYGASLARKIVFYAMLPALLISYIITVLFRDGVFVGIESLLVFNLFVARISLASFSAYVVGQIMDIFIFDKLRKNAKWWYAPLTSTVLGNLVDTFTFFMIAFYKTTDSYLAENLFEIATIDYLFKILVSTIFFLPLYKLFLNFIFFKIKNQ